MNYSDAFLWYIVFLLSTTLHEAAHAFIAYRLGDDTAYNEGQVSLSPIPHIKREPLGMIVIPIISFLIGGWMIGWASTPFNYQWAYNNPKKSAKMAIAGPVSNFILIIIAAIAIHIGISLEYFYSPDTINISTVVASTESGIFESLAKIVSIMFSLNLILFIFNLIPVPPLDGSSIILFYLNDEKGRKYMDFIYKGGLGFIGIFIAWKVFDLIHWKFFLVFINLLYPDGHYE